MSAFVDIPTHDADYVDMGAVAEDLERVNAWVKRCMERSDVKKTLTETWWWWWSPKVEPWSTKVVLAPSGGGIWGGRKLGGRGVKGR